jgi:hypothetical protein
MYNVMSHKPGWCKFAASGSCLMSTINGRFPKLPFPTIVRIRDKPGSENLGLGSRAHFFNAACQFSTTVTTPGFAASRRSAPNIAS